jgi:hypothetical protein
MSSHSAAPLAAVSLYDARPFFEKALQFGIAHGIIDQSKLDAIRNDAPKGMVQIARYFGSEFLRPELEKARDRIVNLVSLYLESSYEGDLQAAGRAITRFCRAQGGSDMLKRLIAMPQNSLWRTNAAACRRAFRCWTLRSLPSTRLSWPKRKVAQVIDAAIWLADALGLDASVWTRRQGRRSRDPHRAVAAGHQTHRNAGLGGV